jgi:hypothetical protein
LQDAENLCAKKISHLFLQLKPVQGHPRWVSIEQRALASVFGQRTRTGYHRRSGPLLSTAEVVSCGCAVANTRVQGCTVALSRALRAFRFHCICGLKYDTLINTSKRAVFLLVMGFVKVPVTQVSVKKKFFPRGEASYKVKSSD